MQRVTKQRLSPSVTCAALQPRHFLLEVQICMRQLIRSSHWSLLLLTSLALLASTPFTRLRAGTSDARKNIWEGQSGGFMIRWSTSDIIAQSTSNLKKVVFSARALAQKDLEDVRSQGSESSGERNPVVL